MKTQASVGLWLLVGVGCGPEEIHGVSNTSETATPTEQTTSKGSGGRGMTGGALLEQTPWVDILARWESPQVVDAAIRRGEQAIWAVRAPCTRLLRKS